MGGICEVLAMAQGGVIRRYWDSSCFLILLNDEQEAEDCEKILNEAKEGKTQLVISPLVQVEVVRPRGSSHPISAEDAEKVRAFFENDYLKWRNIDRVIADLARGLCWQYGVHPRDAIHMAVAIETECDLLETTDKKLLGSDGQIKDTKLKIQKPKWVGQLDLYSKPPS
jgi:predicted nucleic acid-binding protein